jgi:hypothetical protein
LSAVTVPPKGVSMCVCTSTPAGSTYLPLASIVVSACTSSSDSPMSVTRSPSMKTSPV